MKRAWAVAAIGVVVVLLLGAVPAGAGGDDRRGRLGQVIDGDTIELADGQRVRLIGIDTPETHHPDFGDECYGEEASEFVERLLLPGDELRLVTDVERYDRYGRLLAYVYRDADDLFVNAEIVRKGYAYVLTVPPNTAHADDFRRLAKKAREADRGLWKACDTEGSRRGARPPADPSRGCLDDYRGTCVPPGPPDLDCTDLPPGAIRVVGDDPHQLDGDDDGIACDGPTPTGG